MGTRTALVAGGGIGGLAAAIGLRRAGWEVEVFERAPEIREVGAGITLWMNALRALERLGLEERVRSLGMSAGVGGVWSWRGELLAGVSIEALRREFGEPVVGLHRAELQGALLEALGPERVRCGRELTGFRQDGDGVEARFADGSTARGDLLVGADGLHSAVRAQLHGAAPPRYAGYTAWRAVIPFDRERLRPGESWGPGARFGRVPLGDGRTYWFATWSTAEGGRSPDGERAELLRVFGGWHDPVPELVRATPEGAILRGDIHDRPPLHRWGEGRVTLLGDAAHPMTPNLGQGAGQALEDAVVLARCLAETPDPVAALRAYEARRIPRANAFVRRSRGAGSVGQWRNPVAVRLRDVLARLALPALQARQLREFAATDF